MKNPVPNKMFLFKRRNIFVRKNKLIQGNQNNNTKVKIFRYIKLLTIRSFFLNQIFYIPNLNKSESKKKRVMRFKISIKQLEIGIFLEWKTKNQILSKNRLNLII